MQLLTFPDESKGAKVVAGDIPDEFARAASAARNTMLEALYEYSDELMELAMEEKPIPAGLIHRVLRQATVHRFIVPVFCGSALDHAGVQPVLDAVAAYLPSPKDVPPVEGTLPEKGSALSKREKRRSKKTGGSGDTDAVETRRADEKEPFCGLVFKIEAAKHGELYFVRVYSGRLHANSRTYNPTKDKKENVSQLWHIQSDDREQVKSVAAGDIVGVIGLRHSVTGDTLCDPQHPIVLESITFPETVISMAIEPETSTERKKLAETLEMMKRQDPTFRAAESEETGQTIISGMGELHLEVIKHKLLRDFNLNVKVHKPRVSYRETIQRPVAVSGECHRQIAGQQTFAKVDLRMEPFDEGEEPVTVACDSAGNLSEETVAVVLDELTIIGQGGGLFGNPLMKLKVTLTGGQQREGESTDVAFRIASNDAFNNGLREAGVALLEPIMKLQITCPEEYLGDFIGDLQKRRASIQRTTNRGETVIIDATAPLANLFGYSSTMRGLSQGRATHSMEPSAYGPAPPELLDSFQ
ncbi:MAG: elongation factor G [Planctomycetes bacterium]|nr:elongation factor G [Planctomycetota bacterium]